eukprot:3488876-Rhodomonas_salina.1
MESCDGRGEELPHGSHGLCEERCVLPRRQVAGLWERRPDSAVMESFDGRGEELPHGSHGRCEQRLLLPRRPDACVGELGQD